MKLLAFRTGSVPDDWKDVLNEVSSGSGCSILLVPGDLVHGRLHAVSAFEHAARAFDRGSNSARTVELEALLYLMGERQISVAIGAARPGDDNVIIVSGDRSSDAVRELEKVFEVRETLPDRTEGTLEALERSAFLDIER